MLGQNNSTRAHAWVVERLSEYLDERLDASTRARVEAHLRECVECRASLESLRWTVALVKQAPAPALPRAFTLPVSARRAPQPSFAFGFAQFGAALATLLLVAVIAADVITQFGGAGAPMFSAAKEFAPASEIAATPTPATHDQVNAGIPTQVAQPPSAPQPETTKPPAPTLAPKPTLAPPAAAPLAMPPTPTVDGKSATADGEKARSATPAPRLSGAVVATPTLPVPTATLAPTHTATSSPTMPPTRVAQALGEATRTPQPTTAPHVIAPTFITPLRVIQVGLLLLAIFFGALVVLTRPRM